MDDVVRDAGVCRGPLPFAALKSASSAFVKFVHVASQSAADDAEPEGTPTTAATVPLVRTTTRVSPPVHTAAVDRGALASYKIIAESVAGVAADYSDGEAGAETGDGDADSPTPVDGFAELTAAPIESQDASDHKQSQAITGDHKRSQVTTGDHKRTPEGGHTSTTWHTYYVFAQASGEYMDYRLFKIRPLFFQHFILCIYILSRLR